ncbi:hypothetical protein PS008_25035, partial [Shigella sonnei]|nr:hypothetical protein [Shigella sonnei]
DANQNHSEVPPYISQNGQHQKVYKQEVLERLWRKRNPSTWLVGLHIGVTTVESSLEIPQKTKHRTPI